MNRLIPAILIMSFFTACKAPYGDDCSCTLMACFDGVIIKLEGGLDGETRDDFSVTIAYGDTTESPSETWGPSLGNSHFFTSGRLLRQMPKHLGIRISYAENGLEKNILLDSALTWSSRVCNQCSGSAPSCKDDMANTAEVKVDLARVRALDPKE
jgi:hypothetical protein